MMRITPCLVAGVVVAGLFLAARPARADELTPEARQAIDEAFFEALYGDVAARVPRPEADPQGHDRFPLAVLDQVWRLRATGDPRTPTLPAAIETDPEAGDRWPLVTALLAEREHRETVGAARLSEVSPLAERAPKFLAWQVSIYRPFRPEEDEDKELAAAARASREEALALKSHALLLATLAVLGLLAVAVLEVWAWRPAWAKRWDGESPTQPPLPPPARKTT